jgi:hypothetical protein
MQVSTIIEDVWCFERRPQRERSGVDLDVLRSLRKKGHAKHSDLVAASKLSGMSTVSVLHTSHITKLLTVLAPRGGNQIIILSEKS